MFKINLRSLTIKVNLILFVIFFSTTLSRADLISKNLISIHNNADLQKKRHQLITYIWKKNNFPYSTLPKKIEKNILDPQFIDIPNLESIDQLSIELPYNIESMGYFFHAKKTKNKLMIYHEGHGKGFEKSKTELSRLLNEGIDVIALSMPLEGKNNKPQVEIKGIGPLKLTTHDRLAFLDSEDFSSIELFLTPIALSLNYALSHSSYSTIGMMGISGGGWATVFYSAVDPRIQKSYPVAGTLPHHLKSDKEWGDYEQNLPALYKIANYLDLFVMGSSGPHRKQLEITNQFDPCCFSGEKPTLYIDDIKRVIHEINIGGNTQHYLEKNVKSHIISKSAMDLIISDFFLIEN